MEEKGEMNGRDDIDHRQKERVTIEVGKVTVRTHEEGNFPIRCMACWRSMAWHEHQCCQMAKYDPFHSLDCARVEGVGGAIQGKEGIKFCSVA